MRRSCWNLDCPECWVGHWWAQLGDCRRPIPGAPSQSARRSVYHRHIGRRRLFGDGGHACPATGLYPRLRIGGILSFRRRPAGGTAGLPISRVDGRCSPVTLLLAGVIVNTVLGYLGSLSILLFEGSEFRLRRVFTWLMGGIAVNDPRQLLVVGSIILVGIVMAYGYAISLNALAVGEEGAQALGVDLDREAGRIITLGALLTGAAVSISGLIGFLGLAVPHILRLLIGPDHRRLVPASALAGATLLVLADTAARSIAAPTELPVGIFTALLGGPLFLFLLRCTGRESEWR